MVNQTEGALIGVSVVLGTILLSIFYVGKRVSDGVNKGVTNLFDSSSWGMKGGTRRKHKNRKSLKKLKTF